jgi:hypothetical protein
MVVSLVDWWYLLHTWIIVESTGHGAYSHQMQIVQGSNTTAQALSRAPFGAGLHITLVVLFCLVQNKGQDIKPELGNLNAQLFEIILHFMPQDRAPRGPEPRNRLSERDIVRRGSGVDVAGIQELAAGVELTRWILEWAKFFRAGRPSFSARE